MTRRITVAPQVVVMPQAAPSRQQLRRAQHERRCKFDLRQANGAGSSTRLDTDMRRVSGRSSHRASVSAFCPATAPTADARGTAATATSCNVFARAQVLAATRQRTALAPTTRAATPAHLVAVFPPRANIGACGSGPRPEPSSVRTRTCASRAGRSTRPHRRPRAPGVPADPAPPPPVSDPAGREDAGQLRHDLLRRRRPVPAHAHPARPARDTRDHAEHASPGTTATARPP